MEVPRRSQYVEGQRRRRRNWAQATDELPVVPEGDMSRKQANESTDPLVGRLGASGRAHSEGIAYKPLCGEVAVCRRVGRMGSFK